ncbi:MAG: hypothetical protein ABF709_01350 [Leuconostoc pseudomesenteroides]|uniref:hypothetical protein n=1 Tax=Leuconostoc pseudomesenteroides TaxID=33968 RepID=UPI0039E7ECE5
MKKIELTKGKNNQLKKLSPITISIVTWKQIFLDKWIMVSMIVAVIIIGVLNIFELGPFLSASFLFGPSVTALSFSLAMISSVKNLISDEVLEFLAQEDYSPNETNDVYALFSPFVVVSFSWGTIAVLSLLGISFNFSFISGYFRFFLEDTLTFFTIFAIINLIQLMWTIIRMNIEKAFRHKQ